jgi:hypothetical protein
MRSDFGPASFFVFDYYRSIAIMRPNPKGIAALRKSADTSPLGLEE